MINQITLYIGAALVTFWGIAHLFPTANVVRDFGEISPDNKNIITMEWLIEGFSLIFIGVLVATVTFIDPSSPVSKAVLWLAFGMLNILSVISLFTGFKVNFIPFKLCPLIFTGSSLLILWGVLA
jgi:hypothetical protein